MCNLTQVASDSRHVQETKQNMLSWYEFPMLLTNAVPTKICCLFYGYEDIYCFLFMPYVQDRKSTSCGCSDVPQVNKTIEHATFSYRTCVQYSTVTFMLSNCLCRSRMNMFGELSVSNINCIVLLRRLYCCIGSHQTVNYKTQDYYRC
jgi:hypothetical protein